MGARGLAQCLAVLLVALVIGSPTDAGAAPPSPPAQARVCTVAGELVQHGQPGRALELIRRARSKDAASQADRKCALQYAAARRHKARARVLVDWIETLQTRDPASLPSYIQRTAPRTCGQSLKSIATAELTEKQAVDAALGRALRCDRANARARALAKLPPAGTSRVCTAARELIVGGEPQRALDLITKARSSASSDKGKRLCARHYAAALRRQAQAESLVLWVETMQRRQDDATGPQEVPRPPATCGGTTEPKLDTLGEAIAQGVTWALECDQSNARALAIKKELGKEPKTRPQQLSSTWDDLKEKYLEPWSGLLTAFLLWMVGGLLIVRLLPRMLHNDLLRLEKGDEPPPTRGERVAFQVVGWLYVALGGAIVTLGAADAEKFGGDAVFAAILISVVGVICIDQARRVAPRLQVDASGDGVSADHVRAIIHTLGTRPPRGLEVPNGSDATFIKDIGITSASANPVVQAVAWLIAIAQPTNPWQLKIEGKKDDTLNVELFRNQRLVEATVISHARLLRFLDDDTKRGPDKDEPPAVDYAAFAAALAVTTMAQKQGFGGLGGATKWQSVGLQYVGTQLPLGHEHRQRILSRAVEADPSNQMAQVTYWNDLYRRANDLETLTRYTSLLATYVQPDGSNPVGSVPADALRLRALYSLTAASVNLKALGGTPLDLSMLQRNLKAQLTSCREDKDTEELARLVEPAAHTLYWSIAPPPGLASDQEPEAPPSWTFTAHYNAACFWATRGAPLSPTSGEADAAISHLALAGDEPALVTARQTDPQLKRLLDLERYREAFGPELETDILAIPPFSAHAENFKAAAMTTSSSIASAQPWDLQALGLSRPVAARLKELAQTHDALHEHVAPWGIPIVTSLVTMGLTALPTTRSERKRLVELVLTATSAYQPRPTQTELSLHLR